MMADKPGDLAALEQATGRKVTPLFAKKPRRPLNWGDLEGKPPPDRPWLISHWLSHGSTLLAGSGGIGKSLLAQTIATALALGRPFLDLVPEPQRVLFWACEDDHDELWRRQIAICRHFGVKLTDLQERLVIEDRYGEDNSLFLPIYGVPQWTALRDDLAEQVKDYRSQVLILDNIGQTFGCSENDRHAVTLYVNGFASLVPATLLLGHPAKATGSEFSGSTAWENAVRMRWYLGTKLPDQPAEEGVEEDDNVRFLAKRKTNYTVRDYRKLCYRDGIYAVEGDEGATFSGRVLAEESNAQAEATIVNAISRLLALTTPIYGRAEPRSPDYMVRKVLQYKLGGPFSKRELDAALRRLLLENRVREVEVGKLNNRMPRMGLKLC